MKTKETFVHSCIVDKDGAARHQMTWRQIDKLYGDLCEFLADCTRDEIARYRDSIAEVKTLLHKRMQSA